MNNRDAVIEANRLRDKLLTVLERRLPKADAEDVLQSAFLRILRSPDKDIRTPFGYLLLTAKRMHVEGCHTLEGKAQHESAMLEHLICPRLGPEELIFNEIMAEILFNQLAKLSPKKRRIFEMHEFEDYTYDEIANWFQISSSAVKKNLTHAKHRIREARTRLGHASARHSRRTEGPKRSSQSTSRVRSPCQDHSGEV